MRALEPGRPRPDESLRSTFVFSFEFDDLDLDTKDTCIATIRMFKEIDMIRKFRIPYEVSRNEQQGAFSVVYEGLCWASNIPRFSALK